MEALKEIDGWKAILETDYPIILVHRFSRCGGTRNILFIENETQLIHRIKNETFRHSDCIEFSKNTVNYYKFYSNDIYEMQCFALKIKKPNKSYCIAEFYNGNYFVKYPEYVEEFSNLELNYDNPPILFEKEIENSFDTYFYIGDVRGAY